MPLDTKEDVSIVIFLNSKEVFFPQVKDKFAVLSN
jgi:hypothetical protein